MRALRIAAAAALITVGASLCVVTQNCTSPGCLPLPVSPPSAPYPLPSPRSFTACPQYAASGCCSSVQNLLLYVNFLSYTAAFGECQNGGCPACLANVEAFFCSFWCSPEQDSFLQVLGNAVVPDPTRGGQNASVLELALRFKSTLADSVQASCARTRTVNNTLAMQTTDGFFTFLTSYEAIGHGYLANITYTEPTDPTPSLDFNVTTCSAAAASMEGEEEKGQVALASSPGEPIPCPKAACNTSCAYT